MRAATDASDTRLDELATAVMARVSADEVLDLFAPQLERLASASNRARWRSAFVTLARGDSAIVADEIDLDRLSEDAAVLLEEIVAREASRFESPLYNAFAVSLLLDREGRSGNRVSEKHPVTPTGRTSNLWTLPLPGEPFVDRAERAAMNAVLRECGVVVLAGGPGMGKSFLARAAAQEALDGGEVDLVWWVSASGDEQLLASCEALLDAHGVRPGDDPRAQVRALLSERERWMLVIDAAEDQSVVSAVVPAGHRGGKTVITTRSTSAFHPSQVVSLDSVGEDALAGMARGILPHLSDAELHETFEMCSRIPLAIVTVCRYMASTGAGISELSSLLRSAPASVLSDPVGPHYPASFTEVLSRMFTELRASDPYAASLLLALAVSGATDVPHDVLEIVAAKHTDPRGIGPSVHALARLGLIAAGRRLLSCHALIASTVIDLAGPSEVRRAADRILEAVSALCETPGRATTSRLSAVVDAADGHAAEQSEHRLPTRLSLAGALAESGRIASAYRQVAASDALVRTRVDDLSRCLACARVHLSAGLPRLALSEAGSALDTVRDDGPVDVVAAIHVIVAWSQSLLGNAEAAKASITEALTLVPTDRDVQALHSHFSLLDAAPKRRMTEYAALAASTRGRGGMEGFYLVMAARAALDCGEPNAAVDLATRAVEIDSETSGAASQSVARDLNDLGMAYIAAGDLEKGEESLRRSLDIYRSETPDHALAVMPELHLARILTLRARTVSTEAEGLRLLDEARSILEPAVRRHEGVAPTSREHAALLFALADTFVLTKPGRAAALLRRAREIDRAVFGDVHEEVGIDTARLMQAQLNAGDSAGALESFTTVASRLGEWESERPDLAAQLHLFRLWALAEQPENPARDAALAYARAQVERVLALPGVDETTLSLFAFLRGASDG
ncbi:tetratricopeptide repeat protein [Microbacterium sp. XT11]|uniref:tetratricopeptide repeat protein n=1 Tax=Microbacterium sp. XT11 TaxID=367477 RepID=UPI0018DC4BB5|nr:tetratricopeptide repeat protein [Microbacterium sp. XT11]